MRTKAWAAPEQPPRPEATEEDLADAAALLAGKRLAIVTGAGISTDSGIPDYRGPDSAPRTPMTYQQFIGSAEFRSHYWARNHIGWHHLRERQPNEGHRAVAALERRGVAVGVVTQNVDLLHQAAGARRVVDLHGRYDTVVCLTCGHRITRSELDGLLLALNPGFLEQVTHLGDVEIAPDADAVIDETAGFVVAPCPRCGGILKPDITYFGESVPKERVAASFAIVDDGEALLVAGTSLAVMSGLRLAKHAVRAGKPVVIVNRGATRGDDDASRLVHAGTSEALRYLADHLPDLSQRGG